MALARERDLEAGRKSIGRGGSIVTRDIILEETESSIGNDGDSSINISIKDMPLTHLARQGVEETDYGTMATSKKPGMKRPGYVRQVTSESLFKDPVWGKKGGGDE